MYVSSYFSDKLEYLFRQLKTELQYSTNTMEDNFFHIHELKVATERNFALRKLFWKVSDTTCYCWAIRQSRILSLHQANCAKCAMLRLVSCPHRWYFGSHNAICICLGSDLIVHTIIWWILSRFIWCKFKK
jgi:hypothetical protein